MNRIFKLLVVLVSCLAIGGVVIAGSKSPMDPADAAGVWSGTFKFKKVTMPSMTPSGSMDLNVAMMPGTPPDLSLQATVDSPPYRLAMTATCSSVSTTMRKWSGELQVDVMDCYPETVCEYECTWFGEHICWDHDSGCSSFSCSLIPGASWGLTCWQIETCDTLDSMTFTFSSKINKQVSTMKVKGTGDGGEKLKLKLFKAQ